jgi:hypothetical protein
MQKKYIEIAGKGDRSNRASQIRCQKKQKWLDKVTGHRRNRDSRSKKLEKENSE